MMAIALAWPGKKLVNAVVKHGAMLARLGGAVQNLSDRAEMKS
jgi:hypothetical protein